MGNQYSSSRLAVKAGQGHSREGGKSGVVATHSVALGGGAEEGEGKLVVLLNEGESGSANGRGEVI
jgi:hypothetical protein